MTVWRKLREWSEYAPEPPPGTIPVEQDEARQTAGRVAWATMPSRARSNPTMPPR